MLRPQGKKEMQSTPPGHLNIVYCLNWGFVHTCAGLEGTKVHHMLTPCIKQCFAMRLGEKEALWPCLTLPRFRSPDLAQSLNWL